MSSVSHRIENLLRDFAPQVLGAMVRRFRDFSSCEDAVQESLIAAATQWPRDGVPDNPGGWLMQVAQRRMTDHVRIEIARRNREGVAAADMPLIVAPDVYIEPIFDGDDTLPLLFMCCHPAITAPSAIALTLRAIGGLATAEIANAFLVPETTMAQRISRAKQAIHDSGVPFEMPDENERATRIDSVLHVLYLIFNEGYTSSVGEELQRSDLANEAIRLARAVHKGLPNHAEAAGLLALMLLTDARRDARVGSHDELIPLAKQDRSKWNSALITEGIALISATLPRGEIGMYQLQAAIAAVHDEARHHEDTDWAQILALYTVLMRITDNPMVRLNHAIAVAMVNGPGKALDLLAQLDGDSRLAQHHRLFATRAHLHAMLSEFEIAIKFFREAAARTTSIPERDYLTAQANRLAQR